MRDFSHETIAHTENGIEPAIGFDYDTIGRNVFDEREQFSDNREAELLAVRMLIRLKAWDYQDGLKDKRGLMIRSAVSAWAVVPNLRLLKLTQLALALDLEKQSVGRWVDHFKAAFPYIRNDHMRT